MRGALVVGVTKYNFGELPGCVKDAQDLAKVLRRLNNKSNKC
ncbi:MULTISPECIES: caspase family protein [unclassified Sphingobacterium]